MKLARVQAEKERGRIQYFLAHLPPNGGHTISSAARFDMTLRLAMRRRGQEERTLGRGGGQLNSQGARYPLLTSMQGLRVTAKGRP